MDKGEIVILVVEDEEDIMELVLHGLEKDGYTALGAPDGETGLAIAKRRKPHLIVLDLMLPGMDGMAVCRKIRRSPELRTTSVLMLTARGEEADMISGLEAGADDYVVKPFSTRVLLARIRSLLRRGGVLPEADEDGGVLAVGDVRLVPERREATVAGEKVELTAGEYKLLQIMMRRPGVVYTRAQLLDLARGSLHAVTDKAIDVQVVRLRRKLGPAGAQIETVRGAGYRVVPR